jgi:hypothetical protein
VWNAIISTIILIERYVSQRQKKMISAISPLDNSKLRKNSDNNDNNNENDNDEQINHEKVKRLRLVRNFIEFDAIVY